MPASPEDVVELIGSDGQVRLIPRTNNWDEYLKWVKSRSQRAASDAPPFSISSIALEGLVEPNEDVVTLDVTVYVLVNVPDRDVLVPLRLAEATLLSFEYHGPDKSADKGQFEPFDPQTGYQCWLRGIGRHELKLRMAVGTRRPSAVRRLLLSLPETAVSGIKLIVPQSKVAAKGSERSVVRTRSLENSRAEIQAYGLGSLLDLSWQPLTDAASTRMELQATTLVNVSLRGDSLILEATQLVASNQGSIEKVTVRMPAEFQFLDVAGREVRDSRFVPGSPTRVTVDLISPTSGPIELKWTLAAKIGADNSTLPAIEGFEVEDARQQRGFVAIAHGEGFNFRKRDSEDRFLQPASEQELREIPGLIPSSVGGAPTVFKFWKQPFRLTLSVQKIEPYFSAEPTHWIRLSPGHADWQSIIKFRVFRGAVSELAMPWPTGKSENWGNLVCESPDLVEHAALEDAPTGPQLRIRLIDRKTRVDGEVEIHLSARRSIPADGSAFDLALPFVEASGQKDAVVIIAPSDNLELEWTPRDDQRARPLKPMKAQLDVLPSARNVRAWRWESGAPAFVGKAKLQTQTIRTESVSELEFNEHAVKVAQRITHEIAFDPLSQIRLMLPRAIADRVRISWRDDASEPRLLTPVFTGLEINQLRQCRLQLDESRLGRFELTIEFEMEHGLIRGGEETRRVSIPVVLSSDAEFTSTRARWKTDDRLTAQLADDTWSRELALEKTVLWRTAGAKTSIELNLEASRSSRLQDFTVDRAIIRTLISEGRSHSRVLYEFDRTVREVNLFLPAEISTRDFRVWWNKQRIDSIASSDAEGGTELRFRLSSVNAPAEALPSTVANSKGQLWLDFYAEFPTHFGWQNQHRLLVPRFAPTVWVAQTVWEVVLPSDQHLFTVPRDFAAQFHWQRSMLLWGRIPNSGQERIERAMNAAVPNPEDWEPWNSLRADDVSANVYPLSSFGPPQPLEFTSMSRSAVVGCGAGLALFMGFLLIRIPATRHVITFLLAAFAMSLAALWYSEPVKILLQPAVLGCAMAVVAALIDRLGRRLPEMPLVTLPSPGGFYAATSSFARGMVTSSAVESLAAAPALPVPMEIAPASDRGGHE